MREKNKFFRIIIENDSLTDIQTIMGVSPMYITTNLVEDINLALQIIISSFISVVELLIS